MNNTTNIQIRKDKRRTRKLPEEEIKTREHKGKHIDRNQLYKLAQTMLPLDVIADILGCCGLTLWKHHDDVLKAARADTMLCLSQQMFKKAFEGDTKMMIFLSKQHLGYKENVGGDLINNDQIHVTVNPLPFRQNPKGIDVDSIDEEES